MDLLTILPTFSTKAYTHILPGLERRNISTVDLITLDYLEIAKRAHVPPADVRRLCADVVAALHFDLGFEVTADNNRNNNTKAKEEREEKSDVREQNSLDLSRWRTISTLDPALDELLGGGLPTGYLTEVTGESGSGKTQFLLNLLLAAQLPAPHGLGKKAIYISTEAPLSTPRLSQILQTHPHLSKLPAAHETRPSLANILSITAVDLETQDHILNFQLPVAISRFNVGLVVIDSIAANYRAEHASNSMQGLSARSGELARLGHLLRNIAAREDVAIVVANQVSDRFDSMMADQQRFVPRSSQMMRAQKEATDGSFPSSSPALSSTPSSQLPAADDDALFDGSYIVAHPVRNETLSLAHQQRFFTGWGDGDRHVSEAQKTPALGFVWSTQIACRIALKKEDEVLLPALPVPLPGAQRVDNNNNNNSSNKNTTEIGTARDISLQSSPSSSAHPKIPNGKIEHDHDNTTTKKQKEANQQKPPSTPAATATATAGERITKRRIKLVFAPWASGIVRNDSNSSSKNNEIEFEIWKGGIRSINKTNKKEELLINR